MSLLRWMSRVLGVVAALFVVTAVVRAEGEFYLKDGDRVVFYGDSITEQRLYSTFAETFVVTRFPKLSVEFVHSGWGGDRVSGGGGGDINTRLNRDVFAYKPTVVTVMLGMNDGAYRAFDEGIFKTYEAGLRAMVARVGSTLPGVRMTLIQPSPYDDVTSAPKFPGGYNGVLTRYAEAVRDIAAANHQLTADFNGPVVAMLEKAKAADAALATKIIPDRVHPSDAGHLIMAEQLLRAWNAPALVSGVGIDAASRKITRQINTQVTGLTVDSGCLQWVQLDQALPMPVNMGNELIALAVKSSDFTETLNRQPLVVTGLTADAYELLIDGRKIGLFSAKEFAEGINLATLKTPMASQAAGVHRLTLQRAEMHNTRWRTFEVPYAKAADAVRDHLPDVLTALDQADRAIAVMQHAAAQPVPRKFTLNPMTAAALALAGEPINSVPASFGDNLLLNKTWNSSAPNTYGWNSGLTDGSWDEAVKTTFATDDKSTFPKTVTVDLDGQTILNRIAIGVPAFGSTKTVEVAISADGVNFTTVGSYQFSLRHTEKRLFTFAPVMARKVRITYVDHHTETVNYGANFAFTTDLQAFAPAAK